ncbi:TetR/AcrR family transcriptional regulator C-terminal ligand-binding domain-containing protein [Streptomyces huiliensis]|uniref:TetR/AcrR family transcriptional regulator C-terminal ligand-binding domain-containing protein n=1 Tax=Streptomyces huiliensis TaxID=2876027 RepID=UPI001CBF0BCC|nr:TetR/AcrR family transcriptional regulator C-terminal ligand-binding domain-containing protein [Streptomyces huiliensis]MBZ4323893.1 TetR/AcrR family transcriptional regulator C-terminal ligand-binding domain-containing protein [Streptomyces huiliensis]
MSGPADGARAPGASLPVQQRGRPRSAAVDTAVIESVLRLLEGGVTVSELSMERIAREAGVGKATVYRRWAGKEALMLDVLRSLEEAAPELKGVSVRDDLVALLDFLRRRGLAKRSSAVMRTVVAQVQAQPRVWREYHDTVVAARRESFREVLRRGAETGEIRADADVDLLIDLLVSPMLVRAVLHEWKELPAGLAEGIVDMVLDGVRP